MYFGRIGDPRNRYDANRSELWHRFITMNIVKTIGPQYTNVINNLRRKCLRRLYKTKYCSFCYASLKHFADLQRHILTKLRKLDVDESY